MCQDMHVNLISSKGLAPGTAYRRPNALSYIILQIKHMSKCRAKIFNSEKPIRLMVNDAYFKHSLSEYHQAKDFPRLFKYHHGEGILRVLHLYT